MFSEDQEKVLTALGVEALYLFGSRALGKESELSDFDYGVLMPTGGHGKGDPLYLELYDLLSEVSERTLKNDIIDIVFLRDAGLELAFHVVRYGKVLFEKEVLARLNFEERITKLYCDYKPILDSFDKAILERT